MGVAESVERATPGVEFVGSIPAPYWLGWCQTWPAETVILIPRSVCVTAHKLSDVTLGTRPQVADEDVKNPNEQNKSDPPGTFLAGS